MITSFHLQCKSEMKETYRHRNEVKHVVAMGFSQNIIGLTEYYYCCLNEYSLKINYFDFSLSVANMEGLSKLNLCSVML